MQYGKGQRGLGEGKTDKTERKQTMSVCYFPCKDCGRTITNYLEYDFCTCGKQFCTAKCGEMHNYIGWKECELILGNDPRWDRFDNEDFRIDTNKPITCSFCRKTKATDEDLLKALLKHYKITRVQAKK